MAVFTAASVAASAMLMKVRILWDIMPYRWVAVYVVSYSKGLESEPRNVLCRRDCDIHSGNSFVWRDEGMGVPSDRMVTHEQHFVVGYDDKKNKLKQ